MQERLQWIARAPLHWCDWEPVRGGMQAHELVAQRYPQAQCHVYEPNPQHLQQARQRWHTSAWAQWWGKKAVVHWGLPPARSLDMLWSNMALHQAPDPQALIQQWAELVKPQGFLMFSCLGPDTVQELRALYRAQGWPEPGHAFTDMHDLGDMLVQHGFAEPVMDMERIRLEYRQPERLLQELRELGRNFHHQRFGGLRTPRWRAQLLQRLAALAQPAPPEGAPSQAPREGQGIVMTFEIIYGHAFKGEPKALVQAESSIALDDMRAMLRKGKGSQAA